MAPADRTFVVCSALILSSVYILVPIVATAVITDVRFINWALDWVLRSLALFASALTLCSCVQYRPVVFPPQETTISPQTMKLMQQLGEQEARKNAAERQAAADRIAARKHE